MLDVTVLSNLVLDKILDIKDLRTSKRIDFVGGIRGLGELKRRVDSGEMKAAFALYPVSMQQLINIADTGNIMPPKTTWFEPKLRSGVVIHSFEECPPRRSGAGKSFNPRGNRLSGAFSTPVRRRNKMAEIFCTQCVRAGYSGALLSFIRFSR